MRTGAKHPAGLFDELVIDLFAGGGGASLGIERAIGLAVDVAVNHDREAVEMHRTNHPRTWHLCEDVCKVDPIHATGGRPVGLLWASPDCKHFSKAKGGKPVSPRVRGLAWIVVRWAKAVRPRVIILENVEEFATWGPLLPDQRPDPARAGLTFRRWVGSLRNLGYAVEWRELRACDYGAPTTRKRLFVVARCDGRPIVWPEPSHARADRAEALGRKPWRTAAECIDWSLPCPSIFDRKRPLAEKTLKRIAMGIKRFVLNNPRPFIVRADHGGDHFRGQAIDQPLSAVTARHGYGLVTPYITRICQNGSNGGHVQAATQPLTTIVTKAEHCLVVPHLTHYYGVKGAEVRASGADEPLATQTTENRFGLVAAFLAKHYGGVVGTPMTATIGTVTAKDHHGLVAAHVSKFYGTNVGTDPREPLRTVTAGGGHAGLVAAFLTKYYGTNIGCGLAEPMQTVTSKHRFGLVTVHIDGEPWVIEDIGLRMLQPRELARAQGFPDDYELTGSKSSQVARIGNSVPPVWAEALTRANVCKSAVEVVA